MGCLYKRKQKHCTVCGRLAVGTCRAAGHVIEARNLPTIWIKYYQNGRAIRESTGTTKETVARKMLRAREGDVEHGIPINPQMGKITFEDASTDLLNDYKINGKKTHADAKRRIELHLEPFFRGKRLVSINTANVRAYVAARKAPIPQDDGTELAGAANATVNRELALLKRMFSLAVKDGKLHARPHIPMLREDNVRKGFFEPTQFAAVRRHLPPDLSRS